MFSTEVTALQIGFYWHYVQKLPGCPVQFADRSAPLKVVAGAECYHTSRTIDVPMRYGEPTLDTDPAVHTIC